jgi:hypothetical protein
MATENITLPVISKKPYFGLYSFCSKVISVGTNFMLANIFRFSYNTSFYYLSLYYIVLLMESLCTEIKKN